MYKLLQKISNSEF